MKEENGDIDVFVMDNYSLYDFILMQAETEDYPKDWKYDSLGWTYQDPRPDMISLFELGF